MIIQCLLRFRIWDLNIVLINDCIFGFYMAWNIGANDVANSMASAVGAKAITIRQAIFITGILNIVATTFIGFHWSKLAAVVLSWVISPLFAMVIGFLMFKTIAQFILSRDDPFSQASKLAPFFIGIAFFVIILSFLFKTPLGTSLAIGTPLALIIAPILAIILGVVSVKILKKFHATSELSGEEEIFRKIQIGTSCYFALAQGANDVANAIGPLAVICFLVKTGSVGAKVPVPFFCCFSAESGLPAVSRWPDTG